MEKWPASNKGIILIMLIASLGCSSNSVKYEIDSPKAKIQLKFDLKLSDVDVTKEVHYWRQYDSTSTAFFITDSMTITRIIDRFQMTTDTSFRYIWIPEDSPGWFVPSIDKSDRQYKTWIREYPDRKLFLQTNELYNHCFFANLKWQLK